MNQDPIDRSLEGLREDYNPPPETPREEMWAAIQAHMGPQGGSIMPLDEVRRSRVARQRRALRWATAAAAVLVLGVGIGRMTAPTTGPEAAGVVAYDPDVFRAAAVDHLARSESLLILARADARAGRTPPALAVWSRNLLSQTRLLMDAEGGADPVMAELLEDLELVLVQLVGVASGSVDNNDRVWSEINLALEGLEESEVLPRIQAVIPAGPGRYGT